jgi:hypothetical protein
MLASRIRLRIVRPAAAAALAIMAIGLGGCSSVPSWDPTDMLDFLDTKKRAVGDRKPVFPEGVPGVNPGVPKELVRGSPEYQAAQSGSVAVGQPVEEAQPAPPPARGAKGSRRAARPAAAPPPEPVAPDDALVEETPPAAPPPSQRMRSKRQARSGAAPADAQASQQAPAAGGVSR